MRVVALLLEALAGSDAFYLPGVAPRTFRYGDKARTRRRAPPRRRRRDRRLAPAILLLALRLGRGHQLPIHMQLSH